MGRNRAVLVDDALPQAAYLLGPESNHLLAAGLEVSGGALLGARTAQVLYRPARSITVRYDATVVERPRCGGRDAHRRRRPRRRALRHVADVRG